ncbi:MAG: tetratricopeptide repeat protein [Terriglobales bacterium]
MRASKRITAVFAVILVTSLGLSALVLRRIDQLRAGMTLQEVLYIPSANTVKRLSLGYTGLMADIYWTRVVQYFGGKHLVRSMEYKLLGPLLDITTELDPHLLIAYQFGSIFLSQAPPEGAGDPQKAVELVEKGIRANPDQWRLYFSLGFIYYTELKDYAAARRAFERGSQVPGAHKALKVLAASMAQHAGETQVSEYLWAQIYNTIDDKMIRETALAHLRALESDRTVAQIEAGLESYKRAYGRYPASWHEFRAAGWRGKLVDPVGNLYLLKPDGCVEVQDPDQLPFITRGLPPGRQPDIMGPVNEQQSPGAVPESKL